MESMQNVDRRKSKLYNLDAVLRENKYVETKHNDLFRITFFKLIFQLFIISTYDRRKTKIICTIGPSCWSVDQLVDLIDAGMNVARLNFSHGDHEGHAQVLSRLREAFKLRKNFPCAVMLDTKGPEIRTGFFKDGKKSIQLKAGQKLELTQDYSYLGDETKFACSYDKLNKSVQVGNQILIADGSLVCKVLEILDNGVMVEVLNDAKIGERKNMNLPGCKVDLPTVTEKDEDDIVNFGLKYGVDLIALSFARSADDVEQVRDLLGPRGSKIKIICKIENQEGLHNYDDILKTTDGIMVARGDLGMEIPPSKVFIAQKWMISKANDAGKPIVVATQMLESMINNPRPTRAEASDVANAVLDGCDAVMLSGETANGAFPIACVQTMSDICQEAEDCFDNQDIYMKQFKRALDTNKQIHEVESLCCSAVQMSFEVKSPLIVCFTQSGHLAITTSKYRPQAMICAVSFEDGAIKALSYVRGVRTLRVPSFQGIDNLINHAIQQAKEVGVVVTGDKVICITGSGEDSYHDNLTIKTVE